MAESELDAVRAKLAAAERITLAWVSEHAARVREIRRDAEEIGRLRGEVARLTGELTDSEARAEAVTLRLKNAEREYRRLRRRTLTRDKT